MQFNGLFIGLTTIDIQYFTTVFPKSNRKVKTNPPLILVGGPATNAAVAFSKLNGGVTLASPFGINSFTDFLKKDILANNICYFDLVQNQNIHPVIASVITSENGDRNIFTHNPSDIVPDISAEKLFEESKPEILFLDGFYPDFSLKCVKLAKANNIPVVIDCGSWKPQYEELLDFVDIAICSEDFFPPECFGLSDVISYLQNRKIKHLAISRGADPIIYTDGDFNGEIIVPKINVIDTLGAGDFLHGSFCYYFLKNHAFAKALKLSSDLATFSCKHAGTRKWLNFLE